MSKSFSSIALIAAVLLLAQPTFAGVLYPGPFVGADVTYSNVNEASADPINDPEPLYGPPTLVPANKLDFDPEVNAFAADAPPPDSTDGALSFLLSSNTSAILQSLSVSEGGDYQFTGVPTPPDFVAATIFVQILDPDTDAVLLQASNSFFEAFDSGPVEGGFWTNDIDLDLTSLERTSVKVVINNLLQASADADSASFVRKKEFMIDTDVVPEPASMAVLALAGLALVTRPRRGRHH